MIRGACHCGAVEYTFDDTPSFAVVCNCSICRRLGAHWIYTQIENVQFVSEPDQTLAYSHGPCDLAFHSCKTCGSTTHWIHLHPDRDNRIAVNLQLADPDDAKNILRRRFDGADSWRFLD